MLEMFRCLAKLLGQDYVSNMRDSFGAGWNVSMHKRRREGKETTFSVGRLEPVNGKFSTKTQDFLAQKTGVF